MSNIEKRELLFHPPNGGRLTRDKPSLRKFKSGSALLLLRTADRDSDPGYSHW